MNLRDLLNEYKWRGGGALDALQIEVRHRGAPGDSRWFSGRDVREIGRSFLVVASGTSPEGGAKTHIPYHRILQVREGPRVLFARRPGTPFDGPDEHE